MSKYPQTPEEAIRCLSGELARSFYEQANRLFLLETPLGRDVFLLETLRGKECVSDGGFCLEVTVLSDNAHLQEADMLGLPVLLRTRTVEGSPESDRLFHGLITAATFQGANGGFARYVLRIEPWLSDLKHRIDSYVFKDMTVFEIVEEVLKSHPNIHIHWRWSIADREIYPRRSVTMQYWESDFEFIQRLLAEEGLYYWFEHSASDDATLGRHTLVIADHMGAWRQNAQGVIPFQRADVTEPEDSIVDWQHEVSIKPTKVIWKSWDYKRTDSRPEARSVDGPIPLVHHDDPGLYAWRSWADAERKQKNALTALQVRAEIFEGVSTVRTLNAGSWFKIARHYEHDAEPPQQRAFNVIEVEHYGRNNFREEVRHSIVQLLGPAPAEKRAIEEEACYRERQIAFKNKNIKDPDPQKDRFYQGTAVSQGQDYWNRFTAIRRTKEFRPLTRDGYGAQIHPKPTIRGTVTAIVVGVAGSPIFTDRDHRIKIQLHWQRGSKSASRLKHPSGNDNAPSNADELGFWVRVAELHSGKDFGSNIIPRVGQEVVVMFINGDIDRPFEIGAVYNGEAQIDEQVNQVQNGAPTVTGNAPAWFLANRANTRIRASLAA
jgi:type VI secretion system VgrG family protein